MSTGQSGKKNREDLIKEPKKVRPVDGAQEEENYIYEEETIVFREDEHIEIFDHHMMKILFDSALSDFFQVLKKISEISSFFLHQTEVTSQKQQQQQLSKQRSQAVISDEEEKPQKKQSQPGAQRSEGSVLLKDNYDRESLIDGVLKLEQKFQFQKARLVEQLFRVAKQCFAPTLRSKLLVLLAKVIARRPRLELFENRVFQCYDLEISNLEILNEACEKIVSDLCLEEDKLNQQITRLNQQAQANKTFRVTLALK